MRSSRLLISQRLQDYANTYADVQEIRRRAEQGLVSFDFLTRYACRCLSIECVDFDEVRSKYRGWVQQTSGEFAFTHPHKEIARRHPLSATLRQHLPEPVRVPLTRAVQSAKGIAGRGRRVAEMETQAVGSTSATAERRQQQAA